MSAHLVDVELTPPPATTTTPISQPSPRPTPRTRVVPTAPPRAPPAAVPRAKRPDDVILPRVVGVEVKRASLEAADFASASASEKGDEADADTCSLSEEASGVVTPPRRTLATSRTEPDVARGAPAASVTSLTSLDEVPAFLRRPADGVDGVGLTRWQNVETLHDRPTFLLGDQDVDEPAAWEIAPTPPPGDDVLLASELSADWQYTLPAPPTAFRDLSSPSVTEFGTVVLADAQAFLDVDHDEPDRSLDSLAIAEPTTRADAILSAATSKPSEPAIRNAQDAVAATTMRPTHTEDSWEPQQLATTPTPVRTVSGDVRTRPDGVTREVYKVNPLFDASRRTAAAVAAPAKYAPDERELLARSKALVSRTTSADLQAAGSASNLLKNFTISSYEKPKLVDSIFADDAATFKKPAVPVDKPQLARTSSAAGDAASRQVGVKRAASYLSLARPYARPSPFQSVARAQSIGSLVLAEEAAGELRRAASEVDVSRGAEEAPRVSDPAQAPLQSVQLLKSILGRSRNGVDRAGRDDDDGGDDRLTATSQPQPEDAQPAKPAPPPATPTPAPKPAPTPVSQSPAPAPAPTTETADVARADAYVYRGPPAINFGSWSERPKVQVSLKSDKDYRIGGTASTFRRTVEEKVLHRAVEPRIEPKPLTMRLVSQSYAPAPARHSSHAVDAEPAVSRLPIVRAVELKKPAAGHEHLVQLRNTSSTLLNGEGGANAHPLHRHSHGDVAALGNGNAAATARTEPAAKRYTSVVGVNGAGAAFGGAKPMPTVKGFRMADAAVAAAAQPLKTINGAEHNVRAASGWAPRGVGVGGKAPTPTAETPSVVKFRRPTQRPVENRFTNPRDALMDAIKNFGGQDALKEKHAASG